MVSLALAWIIVTEIRHTKKSSGNVILLLAAGFCDVAIVATVCATFGV